MEYTKDIILSVEDIVENKKKEKGFFYKIGQAIKNNKFISCILFSVLLFILFDVMLINSFIKLLSKI